jgi:hypothetical protein
MPTIKYAILAMASSIQVFSVAFASFWVKEIRQTFTTLCWSLQDADRRSILLSAVSANGCDRIKAQKLGPRQYKTSQESQEKVGGHNNTQ